MNGFPERTEHFDTVNASQVGAAWITINVMPVLLINFKKSNKTVKMVASGAYTLLMSMDGFTDAIGETLFGNQKQENKYVLLLQSPQLF